MIDFNDACRYQNHLKQLLDSVILYLNENDFVTTTVKTHHKSDAVKSVSDEIETTPGIFENPDITPMAMITLGLDIMNEREELAKAIALAKAHADLQIDAACMANKDKKQFSTYLEYLGKLKARESEITATGYVMNEIDGKQTPYVYKVTTVKKINYDRNTVKGINARLNREMKETSKEIDRYNLDVQVDFEPRWSEEDSLEDILGA